MWNSCLDLRIEHKKPLTALIPALGSCLPDFLVCVAPPSVRNDAAAGRREGRGWAGYIVEVMGLDDPDYEQKKAGTHARMRHIGPLFRMEATEFQSRFNSIERQAERIAGDMANDLLRRWDRLWKHDFSNWDQASGKRASEGIARSTAMLQAHL